MCIFLRQNVIIASNIGRLFNNRQSDIRGRANRSCRLSQFVRQQKIEQFRLMETQTADFIK